MILIVAQTHIAVNILFFGLRHFRKILHRELTGNDVLMMISQRKFYLSTILIIQSNIYKHTHTHTQDPHQKHTLKLISWGTFHFPQNKTEIQIQNLPSFQFHFWQRIFVLKQ